jgi:NTP pyrophosphatase (non-canonical NTP hydrolase)
VHPAKEVEGFVYMRGEENEVPTAIESNHLNAIERASFVWLHAPDGYVGTSAALEVGFANAIGVPVYAREAVADPILRSFVRAVSSPQQVVRDVSAGNVPIPAPGLRAFQTYYRRVATQRGYERENAQDCLTLMIEEVGELARAIRRRQNITRHGTALTESDEARELSDLFMYVIHMANILEIDLGRSVQAKELSNLKRFLGMR